jgi:hypothetical protein
VTLMAPLGSGSNRFVHKDKGHKGRDRRIARRQSGLLASVIRH